MQWKQTITTTTPTKQSLKLKKLPEKKKSIRNQKETIINKRVFGFEDVEKQHTYALLKQKRKELALDQSIPPY